MFTYIFSAIVSILSAAILTRLFSLVVDDFLNRFNGAYSSPGRDQDCFKGQYGRMLVISLSLSLCYYLSACPGPNHLQLYAAGLLGSASLLIFLIGLAGALFLAAWVLIEIRAFVQRHGQRFCVVDRLYARVRGNAHSKN